MLSGLGRPEVYQEGEHRDCVLHAIASLHSIWSTSSPIPGLSLVRKDQAGQNLVHTCACITS